MNYWLMKSEPEAFSIDDLKIKNEEHWDGIRNYQARNFMRDSMEIGDKVLFYHSNTAVPGVVGVAEISSTAYPDHTQFDQNSKYFDPKSSPENPRWIMVNVKFIEKFKKCVSLAEIKDTDGLKEMLLTKKGMRLSIQPVKKEEFELIRKMGG